ncbi:Uncharacterised protein [Mycobacteroides abscessus subsp. abscessus]|nr:Uncharacterised protein [Mycobacteroides abscessus subsp. abscessus]
MLCLIPMLLGPEYVRVRKFVHPSPNFWSWLNSFLHATDMSRSGCGSVYGLCRSKSGSDSSAGGVISRTSATLRVRVLLSGGAGGSVVAVGACVQPTNTISSPASNTLIT